MAIQRAKVALNAARFPFVSTKGSRSVFVPSLDSAPRTPRQFVGNDASIDYNTPQTIYLENVMPVSEGLRSVGWRQKIASSGSPVFGTLLTLRDNKEGITLYSPAGGLNMIFNETTDTWESFPWETIWGASPGGGSTNTPATAEVTIAYVNGVTVICYSRIKSASDTDMSLMYWDNNTEELQPGSFGFYNIPFDPGTIDGVSASNGYLLLYSGLSVAWARYTDGIGFDFSPYENGNYTGAGVQIPEDIAGSINAIASTAGGFIMFSARNAVAAVYNAQNLVAPWAFKEVAGAGGVQGFEQIAVEGSLSATYAYTTAGLQRVSLNSSEGVFPALSDFISSRQLETFNAGTKQLTRAVSASDFNTKVTNVGNRYLCISYGVTAGTYDYILVYDLHLERWGKLKITHTDCFNYGFAPIESEGVIIPAQHALAILTRNGGVSIAEWTDGVGPGRDSGVAIIGKIALSRSRNTQLNRVEIEGMESGTLNVLPSYDGATNSAARSYMQVVSTPNLKIFGGDLDCNNFSLVIEGAFDLSTLIIEGAPTGQI